MFLGEYHHTLDVKGRIIMPSKFRDELGQVFVVTKGLDSCLFVYTTIEWECFNSKLKELPVSDAGARRFTRFFLSGATECESDVQGRVIIPSSLRKHAELNKNVVSIGVSNRIEIWSEENWAAYNDDNNFIDNELAERMASLGI